MYFAPVDIGNLRHVAIYTNILRHVAKRHNLAAPDLSTLALIHSLTKDAAKGVRLLYLNRTKLKTPQAFYSSVQALEQFGYLERRKRVKTAPFTLYITVQGFELLNSFLLAIKKAERLHFGPKPNTEAQAKGGRISRKVNK